MTHDVFRLVCELTISCVQLQNDVMWSFDTTCGWFAHVVSQQSKMKDNILKSLVSGALFTILVVELYKGLKVSDVW